MPVPKLRLDGMKTFAETLRKKQKVMNEYRIVFIHWMRRSTENIAKFIVAEAKRNAPVDTGTLRSRIDFKVEKYNHMELGIYEDADHPPTTNISKWTNKVRSPSERYGYFVHKYHKTKAGFLQDAIDDHAHRLLFARVSEFHADYFGQLSE